MKRALPFLLFSMAAAATAQSSATALAAARIISPGATITPGVSPGHSTTLIEVGAGPERLQFSMDARGRDVAVDVVASRGMDVRAVNAGPISLSVSFHSEASGLATLTLVTIHNR